MTRTMQYVPVSRAKQPLADMDTVAPNKNLKALLICIWIALFSYNAYAEDNSLNKPFTVEYYYSVKSGHLSEWMELYKKNHWPVMKAEMALGQVLDIKIDRQRSSPPESHRWDVRATITFANVQIAHNLVDRGKDEIIEKLFADRDLFEREEKRRFDLLDGLRSVEIVPVDTDSW